MEKNSRILVTGSSGLVGSAVMRKLALEKYKNIITTNCDLRINGDVYNAWQALKPEYVIHCAALVGGINGNNTRSGEFIYDNLMIQTNVIEASRVSNVKKLLFLGSACIYPKITPQPIKEEYLLSGYLEQTNVGYAVAKIAGITMCQMYNKQYGCNFISVMPTNVYGIGDNFNLAGSHVLPALIRKFYFAKINSAVVEIWGTGKSRREFLYVDDLADAMLFLMNNYDSPEIINVSTGSDVSVAELADIIKTIVGFDGNIVWNQDYPDGTPLRSLDITGLSQMGWTAKTSLSEGIERTYAWFVNNYPNVRL
jgi:GDP-L-fucose synthase